MSFNGFRAWLTLGSGLRARRAWSGPPVARIRAKRTQPGDTRKRRNKISGARTANSCREATGSTCTKRPRRGRNDRLSTTRTLTRMHAHLRMALRPRQIAEQRRSNSSACRRRTSTGAHWLARRRTESDPRTARFLDAVLHVKIAVHLDCARPPSLSSPRNCGKGSALPITRLAAPALTHPRRLPRVRSLPGLLSSGASWLSCGRSYAPGHQASRQNPLAQPDSKPSGSAHDGPMYVRPPHKRANPAAAGKNV